MVHLEKRLGIRPVQTKTAEAVVKYPKAGRNAPCPCGSGKKYKKCCLQKRTEHELSLKEENQKTGMKMMKNVKRD